VPSKNIAGILNNESNLLILGWLKTKPYYPRELAAEMKISEQFIVRRLKAMEECGIVEGKWEREGNHRVKRYYPKDITMQIGKDGLEVTSDNASEMVPSEKKWKYLKKELISSLLMVSWTPLILCGILLDAPILIVVPCIFLVWWATNNLAFYRSYKLKKLIVLIPVALIAATLLMVRASIIYIVGKNFYVHYSTLTIVILLVLIVFITIFINNCINIYLYSSYQTKDENMIRSKREFISSIYPRPLYIRLFYLPIILTWKINKIFNIV
jgi:DNA-binding PadR family transcriptional regulator